jgi:hypothetical protein
MNFGYCKIKLLLHPKQNIEADNNFYGKDYLKENFYQALNG